MKKILNIFIAFMCLVTVIQSMESEYNYSAFKSNLHKSKIDFKSLINPEHKDRIEIHFFWTTGRPYDLLKDEYGADRHVDIGSARWAGKFKSYIFEFLNFVPQNVNVVFVCDRLTSESNAFLFEALSAKFGERFKVLPWESLTREIYDKLSLPMDICDMLFRPKLNLGPFYDDFLVETSNEFDKQIPSMLPECGLYFKSFFEQGFCGNPAIASDIYRLVGMPISCSENGVSFEKTMWTYSDVDTFCYALENEKVDDYIRAILETEEGTFSCKSSRNNDVIKLGFNSVKTYREYVDCVLDNLMPRYSKYCGCSDIHVMNYLQTLFTFLQNNDFEGYRKTYAQDIDKKIERKIIKLTGPVLAKDLGMSHYLSFPSTFSLEWNPSENITYRGIYTSHINACGDEDYMTDLMDEYLPHLRRAIALKRFGAQHPFNIQLLTWLRDNNPYLSKGYKMYIEEYKSDFKEYYNISIDSEDLRKEFEKKEIKFSRYHPGSARIPVFFRFRASLRSLGIEFPILPEDDKMEFNFFS